METKLIEKINQMLESCLRYKRKTDPETLEEYYEGSIRLRDLTKFDEEELDFVFRYLDSKDILVFGTSPVLYSDYPNYRFVKKLDGPSLAKQSTPDETEKLLVKYNSLEDEDEKIKIRNQIIEKNMRLIRFLAQKSSYYTGIEEGMFEGAACIGLIKAIEGYKSDKGDFSKYARSTIYGCLLRELPFLYGISNALYFEIKDSKKELEDILGYKHIGFKEYTDEILELYAKKTNCSSEKLSLLKKKLSNQVPDFLDEDIIDSESDWNENIYQDQLRAEEERLLNDVFDVRKDIIKKSVGFDTGECESLRKLSKEYDVSFQAIDQKIHKVYSKMAKDKRLQTFRENL